ncbi:MAG: N-6 DNA methylase [Planctomycetota bacterium]
MPTTYNERSWAIDVISEANRILSNRRGRIASVGGEATIRSEAGSMFPDVLLFEGESRASVLQGWELKMPDTPTSEQDFIHNAERKARALELDSFLLWNVTQAVLYTRTEEDVFVISETWGPVRQIRARAQVVENRAAWVELLHAILGDLEEFFRGGRIRGRNVVATFGDISIVDRLLENHGGVSRRIREAAASDAALRAELDLWWSTVRAEHPGQKRYAVLARLTIFNWITRFMFAHAILGRCCGAQSVEQINADVSVEEASHIFQSVCERCDFWSVLHGFITEHCVTASFWRQLTDLNAFLSQVRFAALDQTLIGRFLESGIATYRRKLAGQYVTPPTLAEILVRLVLLDCSEPLLDPFCGTGTIPRSAYRLKTEAGMSEEHAHNSVWACDKFAFPLQVAAIAMSPPERMGYVLHVFQDDATALRPGTSVVFTDPDDGSTITEPLPRFKFVASNLPFIQQEDVENANPGVRDRVNDFILETSGGPGLAPRSDFFAYLPFSIWQILADDGRLGIICSNSWLATDWGTRFRELLARFFRIRHVVVSGKGRWFANSDVVTTLLILDKRPSPRDPEGIEITVFSRLNKRLEDFAAPEDTRHLASLCLAGECDEEFVTTRSYTTDQIAEVEALGMQWSALFSQVRWLKQLRHHLVPVRTLFEVKRGERRGWDDLFYPEDASEIESEYLQPVLKTPKSVTGLIAQPDAKAFCCNRTVRALEELGHVGALAWISRFAHETNRTGEPLPETLARPGLQWYEMSPATMADLIVSINPDRRLFVARMRERAFVNQRLIRLTAEPTEVDTALCHALLNSILGVFYMEALGFGRGLGVLDLSASKIRRNMHVLNPDAIQSGQREAIVEAFHPLLGRDVAPVLDELSRSDRESFDRAVLAAYDAEHLYGRIRSAFEELYAIRKAVKS